MRVKLEKRGVLGAGQVQKGGSLPRHIPILNIYICEYPPPPREMILNLTTINRLTMTAGAYLGGGGRGAFRFVGLNFTIYNSPLDQF